MVVKPLPPALLDIMPETTMSCMGSFFSIKNATISPGGRHNLLLAPLLFSPIKKRDALTPRFNLCL